MYGLSGLNLDFYLLVLMLIALVTIVAVVAVFTRDCGAE